MSTNVEAYTILVWGDSLSAAYGIPVEKGWVALLGERIGSRGITVVNKSVSGATTSDGVEWISRALSDTRPDLLILELGANDGLRGLEVEVIRKNLAMMIQLARNNNTRVLLLGMKLPLNYGRTYTDSFHDMYLDLAAAHDIEIIPFFLKSIALDYDLMQDDGYHPNVAAQPLILQNIWPVLSPLLPE
jgi:acyl-CoA thioesterase-1